MDDTQIWELIEQEEARQAGGLEMIPSENHTSPAVLRALSSRLTDKYSEGYAGQRYYGGCEFVDQIELLAIERAKTLFGVTHANVQAYSGSPANHAVLHALLQPGDTIMGLSLAYGGHLTHGVKANFSGSLYRAVTFTTGADGYLDYEAIAALAQAEKPKLIICGFTAYPRAVDWQKFREIADSVGAWLLADISHIAGLVVGGVHASPVGYADVITTTTHKTLRGPRGALILCNGNPSEPLKKPEMTKENLPSLVDRAIFPGLQGGPHNHQTAAIAVALKEAATPEFAQYAQQIVKNAQQVSACLVDRGYQLVTGGTDTHLLLIDMTNKNITGTQAEIALGRVGVTVNKNTVPFDTRSAFDPSGIRLGTPALTTRGMVEKDMERIAEWIDRALQSYQNESELQAIHTEVKEFAGAYPLHP